MLTPLKWSLLARDERMSSIFFFSRRPVGDHFPTLHVFKTTGSNKRIFAYHVSVEWPTTVQISHGSKPASLILNILHNYPIFLLLFSLSRNPNLWSEPFNHFIVLIYLKVWSFIAYFQYSPRNDKPQDMKFYILDPPGFTYICKNT